MHRNERVGVWGVGCRVWGVGCGMWGVGCTPDAVRLPSLVRARVLCLSPAAQAPPPAPGV